MINAYDALTGYYTNYNEDERLQSKHGSVEFLTTVHYIEKYLRPGMKILEIGAGTGRYSHYFARRGYEVDAVELMPVNIEAFNQLTQPEEKVRIFEGNATDLSTLESEKYDMTLVLGPMYHLFTMEDKLRALAEAIRVTKKNGMAFVAYCCADAAIIQSGFVKGRVHQLIADKMLDPVSFRAHSDPKDIFELHTKQDIDALMEKFDVTRLHYVGTDMAAQYLRDIIDAMDEKTFGLFMKYHMTICERSDLVGASNHVLDVFRKR